MKPITDEQLSAYLDGELNTAEMQAIESELAASAELSARMEALRATNDAAKAYFLQPDETPVPDALLQMIQTQPLPQTKTRKAQTKQTTMSSHCVNLVHPPGHAFRWPPGALPPVWYWA